MNPSYLRLPHTEQVLATVDRRLGIGLFDLDLATQSIRWSPTVFDIYGLPYASKAVSLEQALAPLVVEDRTRVAALMMQSIKHRTSYHMELHLRRPDGETRLVEVATDPVEKDDRVVALVGGIRDISARGASTTSSSDQWIQASELVSHWPVPAILIDRQMKIVACSDLWLKSHGLGPRKAVLGADLIEIVPGAPVGWALEHDRVLAGHTVQTERVFHNPVTRRPVPCRTTISPWRSMEGAVVGTLTVIGWSEFSYSSRDLALRSRRNAAIAL